MAGRSRRSVELALSGTVPLGTVLPAMLGVHALIGIGEAVVTVAAVGAVLAARADLVRPLPARRRPSRRPRRPDMRRASSLVALARRARPGGAASPFASSSPTGSSGSPSDRASLRARPSPRCRTRRMPGYAFPACRRPRSPPAWPASRAPWSCSALGYGVAPIGAARPRGTA